MKKTPNPKWNLIVADAMMFIAVLVIAYPNIVLMETMSASTVLLCSILILSGMAMMLTPYVFEYLNQKQAISNDAKKTKENIDLIFENLSALQLMIAETKEMGDEIEEKLAFQLAKDTDMKFDIFQEGIEKLRDNVKAKLKEINTSLEELHTKISDTTAISESATMKFDELSEIVTSLKDSVDTLERLPAEEATSEDSTEQQQESFNIDESSEQEISNIDDINDEEDLNEEHTEDNPLQESTEATPEDESNSDDFEDSQDLIYEIDPTTTDYSHPMTQDVIYDGAEDIIDDDSSEEVEMQAPEDSHIAENEQTNKLSGLMSKALGNAMSVAPSVEKLISASQPKEEIIEIESGLEDVDEVIENNSEQESDISVDSILDDIDFDDEKKTNEESNVENLDSNDITENDTNLEELDSSESPLNELLFDDLPKDVKVKPTKKDASITLHALIGIGNKPYLRGDNSLLRTDKGTPMDYAEIGVWKAVLPPFEGELNFTIWKNDEQQIGEKSYTILSGKKQEITL